MSNKFDTVATNTWCPGCGNFAILNAVKQTLAEMNKEPWEVVAVTGIGCHGKFTDYIGVNGIHTIHGRVLPVATAVKLANHDLTVLGFAGDGDGMNIVWEFDPAKADHMDVFGGAKDMHGQIEHFVECILDDKQPRVTGLDGLKAVEAVVAANQSLKSGAPVELVGNARQ